MLNDVYVSYVVLVCLVCYDLVVDMLLCLSIFVHYVVLSGSVCYSWCWLLCCLSVLLIKLFCYTLGWLFFCLTLAKSFCIFCFANIVFCFFCIYVWFGVCSCHSLFVFVFFGVFLFLVSYSKASVLKAVYPWTPTMKTCLHRSLQLGLAVQAPCTYGPFVQEPS